MVDTTTDVLGLVKQTIGGNRNTWGTILNTCMDLIEGAFYGMTSKVVTGAGDVTLSDAERRKRILVFTGTLVAHQTIIVANLVGRWTVRNATTGSFDLKFKTSSGSAVTVPQTGNCNVWCDGNDNVYADLSTRLRDTQALAPSGTLAAPGQSWASEIASGFYRVSAGVFAFVIAGVARVRLEAAVFKVTLGSAVDVISATDTSVNIGVPLTIQGERPIFIGMEANSATILEPNGWKWRNGQALSRTIYALLFEAITITATATRNGTTALSSVSVDMTGLGLEGSPIEGSGIASGTTIASMTSTTITLSQAASGSGSMTIRILPNGEGDGSTTFNVPDDRGRVNPGRDNMGVTSANRLTGLSGGINGDRLAATGGAESHALTEAQLAAHDHTAAVTDSHAHGLPASFRGTSFSGTTKFLSNPNGSQNAAENETQTSTVGSGGSGSITVDIADAGSGAAHNNVQPGRITNKLIFTGVFA